jgi:hypothetical protein
MDGVGASVNGEQTLPGGATRWRADASAAQLLRAASGLEEIAATCAGTRRDELLEMVEDLRVRAWSRRDIERRAASRSRATLR